MNTAFSIAWPFFFQGLPIKIIEAPTKILRYSGLKLKSTTPHLCGQQQQKVRLINQI